MKVRTKIKEQVPVEQQVLQQMGIISEKQKQKNGAQNKGQIVLSTARKWGKDDTIDVDKWDKDDDVDSDSRLFSFVVSWRQLFVSTLQPINLPRGWEVERPLLAPHVPPRGGGEGGVERFPLVLSMSTKNQKPSPASGKEKLKEEEEKQAGTIL